LVARGQSRTRS